MSKKLRNILFATLLVQLIFLIFHNLDEKKIKFINDAESFLEEIELQDLQQIEIQDHSGSLVFEKKNNQWFHAQSKTLVDSTKIKKFVINLKAIKLVKKVVSETLLGQLNAREDIQKKIVILTATTSSKIVLIKLQKPFKTFIKLGEKKEFYEIDFDFDELAINLE